VGHVAAAALLESCVTSDDLSALLMHLVVGFLVGVASGQGVVNSRAQDFPVQRHIH
jgi:hypothetical protein